MLQEYKYEGKAPEKRYQRQQMEPLKNHDVRYYTKYLKILKSSFRKISFLQASKEYQKGTEQVIYKHKDENPTQVQGFYG